jgi:hypothetical protein
MIEPDHRDPELYLANTFGYSQRRHLAEHAYQQTRALLRSDGAGLSTKLHWHGISLNHAALDDSKRRLTQPDKVPTRIGRSIASLQQSLNDLTEIATARATRHSH